jgi:hypothetical protein
VDGYVDYAGSEAVLRRAFKATVEQPFCSSRPVSGDRLRLQLLPARSAAPLPRSGIEITERAVRFCHGRGLADVRHGVLDAECRTDKRKQELVEPARGPVEDC